MGYALPCAAAALVLLAGCDAFGPKPRTSLEITTRDGSKLLVVDAKVNYLRVCYESTVSLLPSRVVISRLVRGTRDGSKLLVVDAKVNYLRVCYESTVASTTRSLLP